MISRLQGLQDCKAENPNFNLQRNQGCKGCKVAKLRNQNSNLFKDIKVAKLRNKNSNL